MPSQRWARVAASTATAALALGICGVHFASAHPSRNTRRDQQKTTTAVRRLAAVEDATRAEAVIQVHRINVLGTETRRLQLLAGVRPVEPPAARLRGAPVSVRARALVLWRRRLAAARRLAAHPPHLRQWLCIHHYEGGWHANTGNGYYGGLQMDVRFQSVYGRRLLQVKGTADRWSPVEQMWVAERAHRVSGFWPWPNTARMCGLL